MKKLVFSGLACASLLLATPQVAYAHGGQYRGPGDVVPPNPGGGGGSTPGPRGPSTPGPGGPSAPGPAGPSTPSPSGPATGGPAGGGPATGPRGAPIESDLNRWQFWWEFNKDPFINLKQAIHAGSITTGGDDFFMGGSSRPESKDSVKPTEGDVLSTILPALKKAIDSTEQRDIVSSCLVAMAKIGKNHETFNVLDLMRARLKSKDQEIRETAALSMGISQMTEAIADLVNLAKDTAQARELCDRSSVDNRTRAFACYGLGLIAWATGNPDQKRQCFEALRDILHESTKDGVVDRNIPVAAINGIRLVRPNPQSGEKDQKLQEECIATLWDYYQKKAGPAEQQIQAHALPAIAQLLGRGGDKTGKFKDAFAAELVESKRALEIYQSAAIALGVLAYSEEVEKNDKKYSEALLKHFDEGRDEQARYFSLIALAKIGGAANRTELLRIFDKGSKALVKPWAAIALGVLTFNAAKQAGDSAEVDSGVGNALLQQINELRAPETQAAIAIGLGLCKFREAADTLESLLGKNKHQDELAGYLCIGLALMEHTRSMEAIRDVVRTSVRRPERLKQAAIARGKLGDKTVTTDLQRMLVEEDQNVAKLSAVASALGYIGDRRTIGPLIQLMENESITPLSRAFAAVALGGVADKEPLPWNSKIAVDMNYRASVETLTNQATGILDIL